MKKTQNILAIVAIVFSALAVFVAGFSRPTKDTNTFLSGVNVGNDYIATTTSRTIAVKPVIWHITATSSTDTLPHTGTFGGCMVTAAGSAGGNINFYDATTTRANQRWPQATSSVLIASFPTDLAAGTYTVDARYERGIIVVTDGTIGTSTCEYRPER